MIKRVICALVLIGLPFTASAQRIMVEITNLTQGIYFTPLLVAAHDGSTHAFQPGQAASTELQAMAEVGDISGLSTMLQTGGAVVSENPAGGLLAPATSTQTGEIDTGTQSYLSITGMLLPTNDGFVGLDAWAIPTAPGTYTVYLSGYDAGTEVNDEIVNGAMTPGTPGIPANPGGNGGTNGTGVATTEPTQVVHIHRGNLGDTNPTGGPSDLDSRLHRWLNPVAKVQVTVL
jgi:hypothetical protein